MGLFENVLCRATETERQSHAGKGVLARRMACCCGGEVEGNKTRLNGEAWTIHMHHRKAPWTASGDATLCPQVNTTITNLNLGSNIIDYEASCGHDTPVVMRLNCISRQANSTCLLKTTSWRIDHADISLPAWQGAVALAEALQQNDALQTLVLRSLLQRFLCLNLLGGTIPAGLDGLSLLRAMSCRLCYLDCCPLDRHPCCSTQ